MRNETAKARDEADLALLQLHQVQEELEHYFLNSKSSAERGKALEESYLVKAERDAHAKEIEETLNQVEEIKQQVSEKDAQLEEERNRRAAEAERVIAMRNETAKARDEADLALLQLHQYKKNLSITF